uniref:Uncharacterized protein n=1 Tax=viral metagenome TaxID=1070528 RepID=A0A6C0HHI7_9ZZZZ
MEIHKSIVSQALYGDNGRAAIPLNVFMKKSKNEQIGGKKKDIEHLGVPLVIALVEVNVNKPCNHNENTFTDLLNDSENRILSMKKTNSHGFSDPIEISEYKSNSRDFSPISDEMYDKLLNSVLEHPIEEIHDSDITEKKQKKTKKIRAKK